MRVHCHMQRMGGINDLVLSNGAQNYTISVGQDKKIVVGCNTCKKTQLEFRAEQFQKGGKTGEQFQKGGKGKGSQKGGKVDFTKMVLNSLGVLGGKSQLDFNLRDTLDYVENIPHLNFAYYTILQKSQFFLKLLYDIPHYYIVDLIHPKMILKLILN